LLGSVRLVKKTQPVSFVQNALRKEIIQVTRLGSREDALDVAIVETKLPGIHRVSAVIIKDSRTTQKKS
jgi:hypothetical protein